MIKIRKLEHKSSWQVLNFKNEFKFEPVSSFTVTWRWMELICFQDLKKFRLVRTCTYKQSNKSKHTVYGAKNNVKIKPEIWTVRRVRDSDRAATSKTIFVDWFKFSEKWDPILIISIFVSDIGSRHFIVNLKNISFFGFPLMLKYNLVSPIIPKNPFTSVVNSIYWK